MTDETEARLAKKAAFRLIREGNRDSYIAAVTGLGIKTVARAAANYRAVRRGEPKRLLKRLAVLHKQLDSADYLVESQREFIKNLKRRLEQALAALEESNER